MTGSTTVNNASGWKWHGNADLIKDVLFQVGTMLVPNLNVRYMHGIAKLLDVFRFASRCCSEREHSEMSITVHELSDDPRVGVVALSPVRLVCVFTVSQGKGVRRGRRLPMTRRMTRLGSQAPLRRSFIKVWGVI